MGLIITKVVSRWFLYLMKKEGNFGNFFNLKKLGLTQNIVLKLNFTKNMGF